MFTVSPGWAASIADWIVENDAPSVQLPTVNVCGGGPAAWAGPPEVRPIPAAARTAANDAVSLRRRFMFVHPSTAPALAPADPAPSVHRAGPPQQRRGRSRQHTGTK